jgi:hypothetical protein
LHVDSNEKEVWPADRDLRPTANPVLNRKVSRSMSEPTQNGRHFFTGLGTIAIMPALAVSARASEQSPTYCGTHITTDRDRRAVLDVLITRTRAVNTGDEALCELPLLDQKVPYLRPWRHTAAVVRAAFSEHSGLRQL